MFDGTWRTGGVVSRTVTVNDAEPVLPAASWVEQFTLVVPSGNTLPLTGEQVALSAVVTASVAVAVKLTARPAADAASAVTFAGTVTTGAVVSRTVTVNEAEPVLPSASWVEQFTLVVPSGNTLPLRGEQLTLSTAVTASVAVAVKSTVLPAADAASVTIFEGTVTTGLVVSRTVTLNDAVAGLPASSCVEQLTCVEPSGNMPLACEQVTVSAAVTASVAVALKVNDAPLADVASRT